MTLVAVGALLMLAVVAILGGTAIVAGRLVIEHDAEDEED